MPRNRKSRYIGLAKQAAAKYKIPWPIFASMIDHESAWNPAAVSSAGAIGLGQLMPGTARGMGVDPWDPKQNLDGAARYLSGQFSRTNNWRDALRSYNFGPSGAAEDPNNGLEYANSVLAGRSAYKVQRGVPAQRGHFTADGFVKAPQQPMSLGQLAQTLFPHDEEFVEQFSMLPGVLGGTGPVNGRLPDEVEYPGNQNKGTGKAAYSGEILSMPQHWKGSHITDGLNWNNGRQTAVDIMAKAGTPVGAPEAGKVIYWHPTGAQGGGSILFQGDSGVLYWLGHLDNGAAAGTHVKRGGVIAVVSSDHADPHVHLDRYQGNNPGRYIR